ncbi:MAG: MoaD/ThiS family protein [Candidatus Moduliflexus flocculans]|nr:MoaD/ThiS family protein [Candidatus Moduliflexus flocculans]
MTVHVRFFAYFRDLFGGRGRELSLAAGATVGDALAALCDTPARRGEIFAGGGLKPHLVVMVNGAPVDGAERTGDAAFSWRHPGRLPDARRRVSPGRHCGPCGVLIS